MPTSAMPPSVRVFGPPRLISAAGEVELGRRRERNVLGMLVAAHGRPVSADRLVVEVWGEEAPRQALASLQVAVSRLRRILEPERSPRAPATVLRSSAAGYSIALPLMSVDVWEFEAMVVRAAAGTTPAERREAAEAAIELWRAAPYAGCDAESVVREAERLDELFVTVREVGARALLDLGEPAAAVTALEPLLADHPYRERLWAAHALALYRTARQSDALDSLRVLRERLADDLGIDPTSEVRDLEAAILNQDPSLSAPAAASTPSPEPTPRVGRTPTTGFVGRAAALTTVHALLHDALARSHAEFVVVSGEPGIGKTRFVEQVATLEPDALVVLGRSHPDFAPALWPWLPVLRGLWERSPAAADAEVVEPVLADVPRETDPSQGSALRLFDAVARLLTRSAGDQPLVLVLEDLHWADVTSLRLLAHVAAAELAVPLLVVGTMRTGEVASSEALVTTLADLARAGAARIRLEGLAPDEVTELLTDTLGPHDERLDTVVADVTAGNAFFVLEYARLVQGRPDLVHLPVEELPVPDGVRDVLRQRLARLPDAARGLLATAAVAGRIEPELLAGLTGVTVDRTLDLLDLALASGLLAETAGGYQFAHTLTREALAGDLTAARRLRLHDQVSRELETRYGDAPDVVAEVAHHADLAASLGPEAAARAASALVAAARVAQARQAHDEALELWQRAAARASGADAGVRRVEALTGSAYCMIRLARAPEARTAVIEAVSIARAAGRWDLVADAAAMLNRRGVWAWREPGSSDPAFLETLHEALDHVDDVRRARLLAVLQSEHYFAWNAGVADDLGERALAVARASGDEAVLVEVLLAYVVAHSGPGTSADRLAAVEELRSHALSGEVAAFTEFTYARTLYERGRVEEADAAAARCAAAIARLRHTGVDVPLAWWFLSRARESEDPDLIRSALTRLDELLGGGAVTAAGIDAIYRWRTRDPAAPVDPSLLDSLRRTGAGQRAVVALDLLEAGDPATAVDLLGDPTPPGASDYSVLAERCLRIAVLAGAGVTAGLADAVAAMAPYSGDVVTFGAVDHLGVVDHFLAVGTAALGDRERAERYCAAALEQLDRLGNRPWRRRAEALAAQLRQAATG
ncbi:BTAD domain-containing putative transcriptional regulator [Nocardioides pocheonensis]|uniref:BTAD domain-containing putative transcriptional regulator n=1 Tax=Nocardioides pocheonensis TaxID=661485 RepID=UPI001621F0AC|nr:BTAD domain-containing putative transcriptional regulator [Nocardioides pocheonensis]